MKNPFTNLVLPWLLHHANRLGRNDHFYAIKNRMLKKYGKHICYDVQFLEGKECWSCSGTGEYYNDVECYSCDGTGWYKLPVWNILAKVQFGKYTFHQPYQRSYKKPDNSIQIIQGYIEHSKTKYSKFALTVLFLLYEKGYLKRYYKELIGWRCAWWLPQNWFNNIIYLIKYKGTPAMKIKRQNQRSESLRQKYENNRIPETSVFDLPF